MSSGIDFDVRFDHAEAALAIRVINSAIAETEAMLKRRRQRKFALDENWDGRAREWYEDRYVGTELVSFVLLDELRATVVHISTSQAAAAAEQNARVTARADRARLQREAEQARAKAEAVRVEEQRQAVEARRAREAALANLKSDTGASASVAA